MSWVSSTYAREQHPDDDLDPVSILPVALVSHLIPSGISAAKVYPSPGLSLAMCDNVSELSNFSNATKVRQDIILAASGTIGRSFLNAYNRSAT